MEEAILKTSLLNLVIFSKHLNTILFKVIVDSVPVHGTPNMS